MAVAMNLHPKIGKSSDMGDFLVLFFLLCFGIALATWLMSLPVAELDAFIDRSLNPLTLLLSQPGLYFSTWVATRQEKAWPERLALGLATLLGLAILLPVCIATVLSPILKIY